MAKTKFVVEKKSGYTIMDNYHLRDLDISLKALGLLDKILSLPENWDYSINGLVAICKDGKTSVQSAINELKKYKYLRIEKLRGRRGEYQYIYHIYDYPYDLKNRDNPEYDEPDTENPYLDNPALENPPQLNTNKLNTKELNKDNKLNKLNLNIDKIDKKENSEKINHNILTLELMRLGYIEEDDSSSFYYDELFDKYLDEGKTYSQLNKCINYIVPRVTSRNFIDEYGNNITNKYGYFKCALESNFRKFESYGKELYTDEDLEDMEL